MGDGSLVQRWLCFAHLLGLMQSFLQGGSQYRTTGMANRRNLRILVAECADSRDPHAS